MSQVSKPGDSVQQSESFGSIVAQLGRHPRFVIAVVVLFTAAAALTSTMQFMQVHFKKKPCVLSQTLETIPGQMGTWVQVSKDEPLAADIEETLGTKQYVIRDYVNTRIIGADRLQDFKDKSMDERKRLVKEIEANRPDAIIHLSVTFHTGLVDTVAHIPDRCYIMGGFELIDPQTLTWNLGAPQTADRKIDVRFRDFQDQTSLATVTKINVAYFFHCNGRYESDPLDVRRRLQNLLESHGYYAKIELMTQIQDRNEAIAQMQGFLTTALPNIERCFPKWPPVQAETSAPAASALAEQKS